MKQFRVSVLDLGVCLLFQAVRPRNCSRANYVVRCYARRPPSKDTLPTSMPSDKKSTDATYVNASTVPATH